MDEIFWMTMILTASAVISDIRCARIPNWLTFPAMIVAAAFHVSQSGAAGLAFAGGGMVIGFSIFFVFYLSGGMGAGDIKLMAAIGGLLGPRDVLFAAGFTAIAGGIYAVVRMSMNKNARGALIRCATMAKGLLSTGYLVNIAPEKKNATPLRYGIAIGAGTLAVLLQRII